MSFSAFSKEFTANMYTNVENQFITKYLPQANGDAVRVYLYGLYLCNCREEFDAVSAAKLLRIPYPRFLEIYGFWEECDLVRILSREPLFVEYLPVNAAVGKPKPIKPEKYTEFNRELLRRLSKAGKDFRPYEMGRILEFLENNPMEQQAFLLVAEYCIKKDGDKVTSAHILNKAAKLCREQKLTYEQVERDLSDFNVHEKELEKLFPLLGIYRKPQESDYDLLAKWRERGVEFGAVLECAAVLKKGSLASLDRMVEELAEHGVLTRAEAKEYLARRNELSDVVFRVARKLGVKVQNPRAYVEEYAEKWLEHGYDAESLTLIAGLAFKLRYGFPEMDALLDELYREGVVDGTGVKEYCAARDRQFRLLQTIQSACGAVKKTDSALAMVSVWQSWNFSEQMILEAAKRSAGAAVPLSYMNKLLSEWKREGIFDVSAIPEKKSAEEAQSVQTIAADLRAEREHLYAVRRQRAFERAEHAKKIAERSEDFRTADAAVKQGEIELARAEVYSPDRVNTLREALKNSVLARKEALSALNLSERDLSPQFVCEKCSDTGFLPDGRLCDCDKL